MLRMLQVSLDIRIGDCIMQLLALIKVGVQRGILVHWNLDIQFVKSLHIVQSTIQFVAVDWASSAKYIFKVLIEITVVFVFKQIV